jgi:hypothetical protein
LGPNDEEEPGRVYACSRSDLRKPRSVIAPPDYYYYYYHYHYYYYYYYYYFLEEDIQFVTDFKSLRGGVRKKELKNLVLWHFIRNHGVHDYYHYHYHYYYYYYYYYYYCSREKIRKPLITRRDDHQRNKTKIHLK